jgi:hypothetical protein
MGIVDNQFRTVTCDNCKKTVTYEQQQLNGRIHIDPKVMEENPWLKSNRVVLTADGRNFGYCSDLCEISGLESKQHNMPEPAKVEIPTGSAQAQIQAAAAAAKQREDATKAIKSGEGTKLHIAQ